jgi:hypothetical protein
VTLNRVLTGGGVVTSGKIVTGGEVVIGYGVVTGGREVTGGGAVIEDVYSEEKRGAVLTGIGHWWQKVASGGELWQEDIDSRRRTVDRRRMMMPGGESGGILTWG